MESPHRIKSKTPVTCATGVLEKAGNDLLSRYSHYHGPQVLNGRVRNGNGCGHLGMVTGKTNQGLGIRGWGLANPLAPARSLVNIKKAADRIASLYTLLGHFCGHTQGNQQVGV